MSDECNSSTSAGISGDKDEAISILILGMAGSGKTALTSKLISYFGSTQRTCFSVNLDPAAYDIRYEANIDIRNTINFKEIQKQYHYGPNGAIVTSLNLFTLKFDQVIDIISQRKSTHKYFTVDTPGQVEIFTWSPSGTIISEALARSMPTVILYVVDTPRNSNVNAFMSNMLYACKVAMSFHLPFVIVFNKIDVLHSKKMVGWMKDFESFVKEFQSVTEDNDSRVAYSLCLFLEEFYNNFKAVSVSSETGEGFEELVKTIDEAKEEFNKDFKPLYDQLKTEGTSRGGDLNMRDLNKSLESLSKRSNFGISINPTEEYEESDEDDNDDDDDYEY